MRFLSTTTNLSSFLQGRIKVHLYRRVGWKFSLFLILFLGRIYFLLNRDEKRRMKASLEAAFSGRAADANTKVLTKAVVRGTLFHYYEKLFNAYEGIEGLTSFMATSIEAPEIKRIDRALDGGKGVLFITAHFGGVEYIPIYLALKGYPVSVVAKFATRQLRDTLYAKTKDLGLRIIDGRETENAAATIIRELRKNRVVFLTCDELKAWRPSPREKTLFLGKTVGVDKTINVICRRTGTNVVFGVLRRFSLRQYRLELDNHENMIGRPGKQPSSVGEAALNFLETYIYSHPEQWYQWYNHKEITGPSHLPAGSDGPNSLPFLSPTFEKSG